MLVNSSLTKVIAIGAGMKCLLTLYLAMYNFFGSNLPMTAFGQKWSVIVTFRASNVSSPGFDLSTDPELHVRRPRSRLADLSAQLILDSYLIPFIVQFEYASFNFLFSCA